MFNPSRFSLARKCRGVSKKKLAELAGISPVTITRIEKGENIPTSDTISILASKLNFDSKFFYGDDLDEVSASSANFRSLKAMTAKERDSALASGSLAFSFSDWVDEKFNLPELDLPDLSHYIEEPELAAKTLRHYWSLGQQPILQLIKLMESKGVKIFSLAEHTRNVDAFSYWRSEKGYIFLNTFKTAERSRFDAAHELGHLVLHRFKTQPHKSAEIQANRFASAFLMPEGDVISNIRSSFSLNNLVAAKQRWGVSVLALVYRIHKIGLITDWQYRTFCIQISQRYGKQEPNEMKRESSVIWEKVFKLLWEKKVTRTHISDELGIPLDEITNLLFSLVNPEQLNLVQEIVSGKTKLRLVK